MPLTMTIQVAGGTIETLTVPESGPVVIGRDATCHVVLPSPDVSRRHLTIEPRALGYRLTDDSANGTFIGDSLLHHASVEAPPNVPMRVGPYEIRLAPMAGRRVPGLARASAGGAPLPPLSPVTAPPPPAPPPGPPPRAEPEPEARSRSSVHGRRRDGEGASPSRQASLEGSAASSLPARADAGAPEALSGSADRVSGARPGRAPEAGGGERRGLVTAPRFDERTEVSSGLGPLEGLLNDDAVSVIMVVDPETIFVEREGEIVSTGLRFDGDEAVRVVVERLIAPYGLRIDESNPLVDVRLRDGSRVNALIRPLATRGSCVTIRKPSRAWLTMDDLIRLGTIDDAMARFMRGCVKVRRNIVLSGGAASGRTTLLNALCAEIPSDQRVVTVERIAELQLPQAHVVSLQSEPPDTLGEGVFSVRELVQNALRMRADRIVIGECRAEEAFAVLQALHSGHEGSMTTLHAKSAQEALARMETLALSSGPHMPVRAIRGQVAQSIDLVIQVARFSDGSRRVTAISEVLGLDRDGEIELQEIFAHHHPPTAGRGEGKGESRATGVLPTFLSALVAEGLIRDGELGRPP